MTRSILPGSRSIASSRALTSSPGRKSIRNSPASRGPSRPAGSCWQSGCSPVSNSARPLGCSIRKTGIGRVMSPSPPSIRRANSPVTVPQVKAKSLTVIAASIRCFSSGPSPRSPVPCLLVHYRGHLVLISDPLSEHLLTVGVPVLLRAEIDAFADQWIGILVDRAPVHYAGHEFVGRQAPHRRQTLWRIRYPDLKSSRGEQVLFLRDLLLLACATDDTEHQTRRCPNYG